MICEQAVRWAPALRRMLPAFDIREVRSFAQCWAELAAFPEQFVILEATRKNLELSQQDSAEGLLERMRAISSRWASQTAIAVVMQRELKPTAWMLREAGAVHVATSALELSPLQRITQRHLRRIKENTPQPTNDGLLDSEHLNLPW